MTKSPIKPEAYLAHVRANHADVLDSLRNDKNWTDELKSKCEEIKQKAPPEMITNFKMENCVKACEERMSKK